MATAKLRDDIIKPAVRSWESLEKYVETSLLYAANESLTKLRASQVIRAGEAISVAATDKDTSFLVLRRGVRDIAAFLAQWSLGTVFFCGRSVHG